MEERQLVPKERGRERPLRCRPSFNDIHFYFRLLSATFLSPVIRLVDTLDEVDALEEDMFGESLPKRHRKSCTATAMTLSGMLLQGPAPLGLSFPSLPLFVIL